MFYSRDILTKKGPFARVWLAATAGGDRISKRFALAAEISRLCLLLHNPQVPMALRLKAHLLLGIVRIYRRKCLAVERDGSNFVNAMRAGLKSGPQPSAIDLQPSAKDAEQLTMAAMRTAGIQGSGPKAIFLESVPQFHLSQQQTPPPMYNIGGSQSQEIPELQVGTSGGRTYRASERAITLPERTHADGDWFAESQMLPEALIGHESQAEGPGTLAVIDEADISPFQMTSGGTGGDTRTPSPVFGLLPAPDVAVAYDQAVVPLHQATVHPATTHSQTIAVLPALRRAQKRRRQILVDREILMDPDTIRMNLDMREDILRGDPDLQWSEKRSKLVLNANQVSLFGSYIDLHPCAAAWRDAMASAIPGQAIRSSPETHRLGSSPDDLGVDDTTPPIGSHDGYGGPSMLPTEHDIPFVGEEHPLPLDLPEVTRAARDELFDTVREQDREDQRKRCKLNFFTAGY